MKNGIQILIFFFIGVQFILGQTKDSIQLESFTTEGRLGLMGRMQTGNLDQVSIMPNGSFSLENSGFYSEFNASYHYLKVNGFNAINDFWTYGLYQHIPKNLFYPSVHTIVGFAKSFKIDHSIVLGVGSGVNLFKNSKLSYLQAHLYTGYLNFQLEDVSAHKAQFIGSQIRAKLPVNQLVNIQWGFSSFHSLKETKFWGGDNLLRLQIMLYKNLSINVSHQTYYNNQTATGINNTNTEMLFGFQYQF
jgi:hypothetical protein